MNLQQVNSTSNSPAPFVATAQPAEQTQTSSRYKILLSDEPEKELSIGKWQKRPLLALAITIGAIAAVALAICATFGMIFFTGGMGATLPAVAYAFIGITKGSSTTASLLAAIGKFIGSGLIGGALAYVSWKICEKADEKMSGEKELALEICIKIKKNPDYYSNELERLRQIYDQKLSQKMREQLQLNVVESFRPAQCDPMVAAQHLIQLGRVLENAEFLSGEVKQKKYTSKQPIEWNKYGHPTKMKEIEVVTEQTPSDSELNAASNRLKEYQENFKVIFEEIGNGIAK